MGAADGAVAEAVDWPEDGVIGQVGQTGEVTRRVLFWL
jgi:hypothetical protein